MRKSKKLPYLLGALFLCMCLFSACKKDETGKDELSKTMLSDFSAEIEYLIDMDGNPLIGTGTLTKDGKLRLDIFSPDPFSGMCIECNEGTNADVISLTYSGIKAEVPKASMEKFVFLMNGMSEETACALDEQKKKNCLPCEDKEYADKFPEALPYKVQFTHENTGYTFIYDSITGAPLEITVENEDFFGKIKIINMEIKAE